MEVYRRYPSHLQYRNLSVKDTPILVCYPKSSEHQLIKVVIVQILLIKERENIDADVDFFATFHLNTK